MGKKECTKEHIIQKHLIKHWARVRKEQWRQLSRYAILCPYCDKKYSSLTHLIIHLGIRENPYTWPTCTCPLKPENASIREKQKRHLEEDALSDQIAPTKRLKLVTKPITRPKRARNTTHEPQQKKN